MGRTKKISVIGGGSWGTAFSIHLDRIGLPVDLWVREKKIAKRMREERINKIFLPDFYLLENIHPSSNLTSVVQDSHYVFWAVPTQFLRTIASKCSIKSDAIHIVLAKGIEQDTLQFPYQIIGDVFGTGNIVVLSGPSFAYEIANWKPAVLVSSSENDKLADEIQHLVANEYVRIYTNTDPIGVSLCGAYKNIIAIATGISEGLKLGYNARAAIITRGLAELVRLGESIGAKKETLFGVAGIGDMILTCTSEMSRNYYVGFHIGRYKKPFEDVKVSMVQVAEGAYSTFGALKIAEIHNVELPIAQQVHNILSEGEQPEKGVEKLMSRPLKSEW